MESKLDHSPELEEEHEGCSSFTLGSKDDLSLNFLTSIASVFTATISSIKTPLNLGSHSMDGQKIGSESRYVLQGPSSSASIMPTAAAVAAAAATAKIQAMDAVASNAVALGDYLVAGLSKLGSAGVTPAVPLLNTLPPLQSLSSIPQLQAMAPMSHHPGLHATSIPALIQPPGLAIPQLRGSNPVNTFSGQPMTVLPPPGIMAPTVVGQPVGGPPGAQPDALRRAQEQAQQKQQEELQKKLLEETEPQTLQQQENMSIKGQSARHLVMQKLMRKVESRVVILRNMVEPDDVDESLQEEIQDECTKYGTVERVIIYNEKQSEEDDDDAEVIVKIFVEFSQMSGRYFVISQAREDNIYSGHFLDWL
uniref:Uncharacterized protein n=1 Tax=Timema monikensis TaxID=170555 RepID=A0A7R9EJR9_9NEOP|nr:unnamed protein product [Timema monikensis]